MPKIKSRLWFSRPKPWLFIWFHIWLRSKYMNSYILQFDYKNKILFTKWNVYINIYAVKIVLFIPYGITHFLIWTSGLMHGVSMQYSMTIWILTTGRYTPVLKKTCMQIAYEAKFFLQENEPRFFIVITGKPRMSRQKMM